MNSLDLRELLPLVEMQSRSYRLLLWMADAIPRGFLRFDEVHEHSTMPEAGTHWLRTHYRSVPPDARPNLEDLDSFALFFSTYLENSFELSAHPGKMLASPDCGCYCRWCCWVMDAPHLKTRKVLPADKKKAQALRRHAVLNLAAGHQLQVREAEIDKLLQQAPVREQASLYAYALDMLQRQQGIANGAAVLALWRDFAWNEHGSPKPRFQLKAENLIQAEASLLKILREMK